MSEFEHTLKRIRDFRDARDWMQFHNPKDMASAIAIEASELQQLFLWKTPTEVAAIVSSKREAIEDELADIAIYALELADNLGIDLERAILRKLEKNKAKYPVHLAKGTNKKYNEL